MLNNHGGEIDLDGTNDYIQLNDPFSYQDHTMEMWIKMKETVIMVFYGTRETQR